MENLKKKSENFIDTFGYLVGDIQSKCLVILGLLSVFLILGFSNLSYATEEETDLLLDRFFEYCDNYYNIDFSNNTDIHSTNFQNFLSFIHYNKQQIKAKFYYYKIQSTENLENYSDFNGIAMVCWYNSFNLLLFKTPNNSNYDNYGYKEYRGQWYRSVAYYQLTSSNRLALTVDGNGNISDVRYGNTNGSINLSSYQSWDYGNPMNFALIIYNDNNYYSSVPNFNGNASFFINDSNARVNGLSDYGFFNINYNESQTIEVDEDILFGDLFVGYNYSLNNQTIYLYNETTSQIMDNEIDLIPIGGLYNGRYHYQVVTEDLEGLNEDNQYRLICSSSSPLLSAFTSSKFRFYFTNEQPGQELPTLIILSGDYVGVGSGDGFNNAINDINNNLGVINGSINKINNNVKNISNYISSPGNPQQIVDGLFSGDLQTMANSLGFVFLPNDFYAYISSSMANFLNSITTSIPRYTSAYPSGLDKEIKIHFTFRDKTIFFDTGQFNPFLVGWELAPGQSINGNVHLTWQFIIGSITNGITAYLLVCWFCGFVVKLSSFNLNALHDLDTDINLF